MLPPAPDKCSVCASTHLPAEPHNQMSLYYQLSFRLQHGRFPTWEDAMAHCDPDVREIWTEELIAAGVIDDHEEVMDGR